MRLPVDLPSAILVAETVLAAGSAYLLLLSAANVLWLRLGTVRPPVNWPGGRPAPRVSVLVPARDEEQTLGACLESLLEQSYPDYEVIVLDDQSADGTWQIASDCARRNPALVRAERGRPLPASGWCGKAHAMQQLAALASGEYLLFTDADTVHERTSVAWAVANLQAHRADCLSGYPAQLLCSAGEALVVPAMYIMTALILPLPLVPRKSFPSLAFAIGQYVAFRRAAFEAVGGYAAVAGRISEDVAIARVIKRAGFRTVFLDARTALRCRMYRGYRAAAEGISKNVYDFARNGRGVFAVGVTALVGFVLLPLALAAAQLVAGRLPDRLLLLSGTTFLLAWAACLYDRGQDWWLPFLYPFTFAHLLYLCWRMLRPAVARDGLVWKGRVLR